MLKKFKRKAIFNTSKFQRTFFYPVAVSFFIGCGVSWLSLAYALLNDYFFEAEFYLFRRAVPWLLVFMTISMVVVVFWTFSISNRFLGPFERMVKELDEIIEGKQKQPLSVRQGDTVFEELIKRVNVLIERMR